MSPRARQREAQQRELDSLQDWRDDRDREEQDIPDHRPSSDQAAAVTDEFRWLPIDDATPRGCRLMLINKHAGIATIGVLPTKHVFWTHWAPLPTFGK